MKRIFMAVLFLFLSLCQTSEASLVTFISDFPATNRIIDFNQFYGFNSFGPDPIQVGQLVGEDITWAANSHGGLLFGDPMSFYRFASNGDWKNGMTFAGVNAQPDGEIYSMRFTFNDGPVNFVGGFINYTPSVTPGDVIRFPEARLTVFDAFNNILETYDIKSQAPISTPNAINGGEYRGIRRPSDDIYSFELSNSVIAIDDLTFARNLNVVPEPATVLLFASGLVGAYLRRKIGY